MTRITLGQYYPANSCVHSMDGRFKLLSALTFMVASFICKSLLTFIALAVFTLVLTFLSKVPLSTVLKSVKMLLFILMFTFILNVFFTPGTGEPLFRFWIVKVYADGIWNAVFMVVRYVCLVVGTSILISYTVTPFDVTHSLESLLSPLNRIGINTHMFAMMMFIALRFIPTLADDTDKIMTAQTSRGVDFKTGSVFSRVKALVPILIPLFVTAFRRAEELAYAMECRCYHGGEGRTKMKVSVIKAGDIIGFIVFVLFAVSLCFLNSVTWGYTL